MAEIRAEIQDYHRTGSQRDSPCVENIEGLFEGLRNSLRRMVYQIPLEVSSFQYKYMRIRCTRESNIIDGESLIVKRLCALLLNHEVHFPCLFQTSLANGESLANVLVWPRRVSQFIFREKPLRCCSRCCRHGIDV